MDESGKNTMAHVEELCLCAKEVDLAYGRDFVVEDFNLKVPLGKITTLVGPNGSGKSSVLRALSRLLPPRSGRVMLGTKTLHEWETKAVARQLSVLPQGPAAPEGLTVEALVRHGRYPHQGYFGLMREEDEAAVSRALEATQLFSFADRRLETLSGGERQRAWIAMALAQETPILLLDEPTTFLDIHHQIEIMEILKSLNRSEGLTVVMALHDLNQAATYSDSMVVMNKGRIWQMGSPTEVLTAALFEEVFKVSCRILSDPETGRPYCILQGLAAEAGGSIVDRKMEKIKEEQSHLQNKPKVQEQSPLAPLIKGG